MRLPHTASARTVLRCERLESRETPSTTTSTSIPLGYPQDAAASGDLRAAMRISDSSSGTAIPTAAAGVTAFAQAAATTAATRTATSITLVSSAPVVGHPLNLTIKVWPAAGTANPTGTVTIKDGTRVLGTVSLVGGTATFSNSGLSAGTHTFTAVYNGSSAFAASTSAARTVTIAAAPARTTSTALSATPTSAVVGQRVTLTATVTASGATPAGTVTFKDGTTVLGTATLVSGKAVLATSSLAAGTHRVTAVYGGTTGFAGSSSAPVALTVAPASARQAAQVTLSASATSAAEGQAVTFTAAVRASSGTVTPTGTVTFRDGSVIVGTVTLVNGSASLTLRTLKAGSHSLTATYSGDARFLAASSAARSVSITLAPPKPTTQSPTSVAFTMTPNPVRLGGVVTFRITVRAVNSAAVPTGHVTLRKSSRILATANLDGTGSASITLSAAVLGVGSHFLTVAYDGSAAFGIDAAGDMLTITA